MISKLIPALWIRLIILIIFGFVMLLQDLPWLAAFTAVLVALTIWQLISAYRQR